MTETTGSGGPINISEPRNLGRIAQVVALLGFVLPWITVSCNGQVLVQLSGLDLARGHISFNPMMQNAMTQGAQANAGGTPNALVAIALALIVIGLVLSFVWKDVRLGIVNAVGSVVALGLIAYEVLVAAVHKAHEQAAASQATSGGADANNPFAKSMAEAIKVGTDYGFWLTCLALVAAAFFYWKLSTRRVVVEDDYVAPASVDAHPSDEPPPAL
jgi:hypothetical protein